MKNETKKMLWVGLACFILSGCNEYSTTSTTEESNTPTTTSTSAKKKTKTTTVSSTSTTTSSSGSSSSGSSETACQSAKDSTNLAPIYEYTVAGYGQQIRDLPLDIGNVKNIKIQIVPISLSQWPYNEATHNSISGTGAQIQKIGKMRLTMQMLENESPIGNQIKIPASSGSARTGLAVDERSAIFTPATLKDYKRYWIRFSGVETDWVCENKCKKPSEWSEVNNNPAVACNSFPSLGYHWVGQACWGPEYNQLQNCLTNYCDVGSIQNNGLWGFKVRVETEKTECLDDSE